MLKDLFSLLTIIALLFSSCSKSDEEENGDEPQPTKQTAYFGVNLSGAEFGNVYPGVVYVPNEKENVPDKGLWLKSNPNLFLWDNHSGYHRSQYQHSFQNHILSRICTGF